MDKDIQVEAVNNVQEYIKANIKRKMNLHEISNVAGYSPWHISKIFKQLCGKTIFEYIRSLRLTQAALELRDNNVTIMDTALEFMFNSHEGFTRAFSKEFGITPKKYSQQAPPIKLFIPSPVINIDKLEKGAKTMSKETSIVFAQVIERPERKAIIKRGIKATHYFEYCEEVGCNIWGELYSIKGALYEPIGMWLPPKLIEKGTSKYVQGVEVPNNFNGEVPKGCEIIKLEACKMMIFQGPKYDDKDYQVEVSKVMNAINEYVPTDYGFEWAEDKAPRFQYAPQGERGYIEGRPVKLII